MPSYFFSEEEKRWIPHRGWSDTPEIEPATSAAMALLEKTK